MKCGACGSTIAQVSGKSGGYYGCLSASKNACGNRLLVRRSLAEKVILQAVCERLSQPDEVARVLSMVGSAVAELRRDLPENIRLTEAELASEERRLANFLDFVGEGRGSRALGQALEETERRVDALREELDGLRLSQQKVLRVPPIEWIREKLGKLQGILEQNTTHSALLLRQFLGPIRLEPVQTQIGQPYYMAVTAIDTLALVDTPSGPEDPEGGSNSLRSWRWRESNPRPRATVWVFYGRSRRSGLTSRLPAAEDLSASPAAMSVGGHRAEPPS
jgi:hypothetical protein